MRSAAGFSLKCANATKAYALLATALRFTQNFRVNCLQKVPVHDPTHACLKNTSFHPPCNILSSGHRRPALLAGSAGTIDSVAHHIARTTFDQFVLCDAPLVARALVARAHTYSAS